MGKKISALTIVLIILFAILMIRVLVIKIDAKDISSQCDSLQDKLVYDQVSIFKM